MFSHLEMVGITKINNHIPIKHIIKGELRAKFYPNFFFIYRFVYAYYNVMQKFYHFWKRFPEVMTFLSFPMTSTNVTSLMRNVRTALLMFIGVDARERAR